ALLRREMTAEREAERSRGAFIAKAEILLGRPGVAAAATDLARERQRAARADAPLGLTAEERKLLHLAGVRPEEYVRARAAASPDGRAIGSLTELVFESQPRW